MVSCVGDFILLMFVLIIVVVVFVSMIYFIECDVVEGKFISIFDSMWYIIVIMIILGWVVYIVD